MSYMYAKQCDLEFSVRIVQKEVGGSKFSLGGGVERRGGGGEIFFRHGFGKEVNENKSSLWCKCLIRNRFKRSSHCLPQQYLIISIISIISHAPNRFVLLYTVK